MTLVGFDGYCIHRSNQSFLFLGNGIEDRKLALDTLCVLPTKTKSYQMLWNGQMSSHQRLKLCKKSQQCHRPKCIGQVTIVFI
jgi:hypothetical protein